MKINTNAITRVFHKAMEDIAMTISSLKREAKPKKCSLEWTS